MSGGKIHDGATVAGAIATWFVCDASPVTHHVAGWVTAGVLLGGLLISPDMDCSSSWGSKSLNRWRIKLGRRLKLDLRWLWKPYQMMTPHRGWLSHSPIVGSGFRFAYLCIITLGLVPFLLFKLGMPGTIAILAGNEIGAAIHLMCDGLFVGYYITVAILAFLFIKALEMGWIVIIGG